MFLSRPRPLGSGLCWARRDQLNILKKLFPRSLEEAASYGSASGVRRYLRSNPTQESKNNAFLASVKGRSLEIARILFEHGANINVRDGNGDSALHYACAWPNPQYSAVEWLVANGADVNASNNDGMTPETGHTPLFDAASGYDNRLASFLLQAGANVNALTPDGSALHSACRYGFKYTEDIFRRYGGNIVATLLDHGADPNLRDQFESKTPLHAAADFSHPSDFVKDRYLGIVTLLLAHGADPSLKDKKGKTPLDYAETNGHSRIAEVLRQALLRKHVTTLSRKTLLDKAQDAPIALRIMIEVIQTRLERDYPQVLLLPRWTAFVMAGTVAGCVGLATRLHFDVPEKDRTPLEMAMREVLQRRFPQSEQVYEDCYRFVTHSLMEIPRSERGKHFFVLLGFWVLAAVADGAKVEKEDWIAGHIAEALQNETIGFWKQPYPNVSQS